MTKAILIGFAAIMALAVVGTAVQDRVGSDRAVAEAHRLAAMTPEQRAAEKAATEKAGRLTTAQSVCQEFVVKTLDDPRSAEFEDFRTFPAAEEKGDTFHVQVKLRARNGFNALRRVVIDCRTKRDMQGNWIALRLKEL